MSGTLRRSPASIPVDLAMRLEPNSEWELVEGRVRRHVAGAEGRTGRAIGTRCREARRRRPRQQDSPTR
jgi:hypothetical protein